MFCCCIDSSFCFGMQGHVIGSELSAFIPAISTTTNKKLLHYERWENVKLQKQSRTRSKEPHDRSYLQQALFHLHTLYLFTASDHTTFVLPEALFGICCALSRSAVTPSALESDHKVYIRIPQVFLWAWLNTLVFVFSNQGSKRAIKEDSLNKPWRPLPAGRLKLEHVRLLMLFTIPAVLAITYLFLGGFEETAVLFCLTWMYNDLGASDHFLPRDLTIATAYFFYGSGALRVASGRAFEPLTVPARWWLRIVSAIISTTVSVQDLKDQRGDRLRKRKTLPLAIGERNARLVLAVAIGLWSWVCCAFWKAGVISSAYIILFGLLLSSRLLFTSGVDSGRTTWHLWSFWLISLYMLPIFKRLERGL